MRRIALLATLLLLRTGPILAQSQVQHFNRTTPETAGSPSPVPNASVPENPSSANPAGPLRIAREEAEPEFPVRPAVPDRDELGGHFRLGAAASYGTFSGRFLSNAPIGKNLGGTAFVDFDLGYGLSRNLELVAAASLSTTFAGSRCDDCTAKSWAVGPMLRYHLVEGTRFSPWLAFGVAFRRTTWDYGLESSTDSLEFAKLAIGGDWYVTSKLALGPILTLGLDTAFSAPTGAERELFANYHAGLRLTLDLPGR